ncbi:MAG TPA: complex I subunit 1 family protein [Terriglobales bacterium]|nr:complex I subunit 1 family protein [Terriglobales bacterium]
MDSSLISNFVAGLVNIVLVLLVAPLAQGILRKVTARIQSRQGPPVLQPYFDLLKLLGKEDIEAGEIPLMQRFVSWLSLASVLAVAALVPMGLGNSMNVAGDVVLLVYLLTLCSVCTLLAGLAAGSTYSLLGISREMMTMITLEPLLAVAVIVGAIHAHSLRLDAVLSGSAYFGAPWSGVLMLIIMLFAFQAFVQRVPFDVSEAETELMEGPLMEYSGPKLALFKYAQMIRMIVYAALFIGLFAPLGLNTGSPLAFVIFWIKIFGLVLLVAVIGATHARYRIDQAIRYFAAMLGTSLVALLLASYGY